MSKEIVTIGDPHLADETIYCPNCGIQIDYQAYAPNYCPSCGGDMQIQKESVA